ncbi:DUF7011 domain-containing protein [Variovorax atrisoli]|uniref:DUF7011 domain-containing protein n=1 Tax=Variovorax atrisoli TaxID=3394203 RepID=UPI00386B6AFE
MQGISSTTGRASDLGARPCRRGAALPDADPWQGAIAFASWNICGHKQLIHDGKRLTLIVLADCPRLGEFVTWRRPTALGSK